MTGMQNLTCTFIQNKSIEMYYLVYQVEVYISAFGIGVIVRYRQLVVNFDV